MNKELIIILIFIIILLCLFIVSSLSLRKQVTSDWETLRELQEKADKISTKEEIEEFSKEFAEKANKIYNRQIHYELHKIDGFLKGLYKQYKN